MAQPAEKLLIQTYKYINESRDMIEQIINEFGQLHQKRDPLPPDIQQLVDIALNLSPEQRRTLRLFLESIKEKNEPNHY